MTKEAHKQAQYKAEGIIIWIQVNINIFSLFILSKQSFLFFSDLLASLLRIKIASVVYDNCRCKKA